MLVFAGILLLTVPPPHRPFHQAVEATGAAALGASFAILLATTTYDQPWLYLPLQCAALTVLLVLSRITPARPAFILAALVLSFAEPAYLPDPEAAIEAALLNALALASTAWAVAAASAIFGPPAAREDASVPPGRRELVGFGLLEIRTGVIAVLLTADPDLRAVWRRMPFRQLCATSCAALAFLMIAVGAPLMDDLGFFAVIAAACYFTAGWVAHGSPRISFACVPGAVTVTLVLLLDVRFTIDFVPSLLNVAGAWWGFFVTALIALLLAPWMEQQP